MKLLKDSSNLEEMKRFLEFFHEFLVKESLDKTLMEGMPPGFSSKDILFPIF